MNENDYCFECGKKFEDGEAVSGSPVDGYCCKGGCKVLLGIASYHYKGYYHPVPELIPVDFAKLEKRILNSYLNYSEIIEELWKFPKQGGKQMKFGICKYYDGWIVSPIEKIDGAYYYLWKDLELHRASVGYVYKKHDGRFGSAAGYYNTEDCAKRFLQLFKEKHNMTEQEVEITVKVNGVATPLHKISEQTLLTVRENSKPKEIPVARTVESNGRKYLLLRVPGNIKNYTSKVVAINLKGGYINGSWKLEDEQKNTCNGRVFSYGDVKIIE